MVVAVTQEEVQGGRPDQALVEEQEGAVEPQEHPEETQEEEEVQAQESMTTTVGEDTILETLRLPLAQGQRRTLI